MPETPTAGLGRALRRRRDAREQSLRAVAEPAGISAAYLAKLERGEVTSPSPHVLHALAGVLDLAYLDLMRLVGYVVPASDGSPAGALSQAMSTPEKLTEDEERALATYLQIYRSRKS